MSFKHLFLLPAFSYLGFSLVYLNVSSLNLTVSRIIIFVFFSSFPVLDFHLSFSHLINLFISICVSHPCHLPGSLSLSFTSPSIYLSLSLSHHVHRFSCLRLSSFPPLFIFISQFLFFSTFIPFSQFLLSSIPLEFSPSPSLFFLSLYLLSSPSLSIFLSQFFILAISEFSSLFLSSSPSLSMFFSLSLFLSISAFSSLCLSTSPSPSYFISQSPLVSASLILRNLPSLLYRSISLRRKK